MKAWIIAIVLLLTAGAGSYYLYVRSRAPAQSAIVAEASRGFAACTNPTTPAPAPDGTTATKDQMLAARRTASAFDTAITAYTQCLDNVARGMRDRHEFSAAADMQQIARFAVEKHNAAIERDQNMADQVNEEIRKFKARGNCARSRPAKPFFAS